MVLAGPKNATDWPRDISGAVPRNDPDSADTEPSRAPSRLALVL